MQATLPPFSAFPSRPPRRCMGVVGMVRSAVRADPRQLYHHHRSTALCVLPCTGADRAAAVGVHGETPPWTTHLTVASIWSCGAAAAG